MGEHQTCQKYSFYSPMEVLLLSVANENPRWLSWTVIGRQFSTSSQESVHGGSQPIRVHGGHLGFPIATKGNNTSAEPLEECLWQVW